MSTHRGVAITARGVIEEVSLPTPDALGPTEVLVESQYSAVIAFDAYMSDFLLKLEEKDLPVPVSIAASGYVKAVGDNVQGLKPGDPVTSFCVPPNRRKAKAMQEFFVVDQTLLGKIPSGTSLEAAATLPDNFVTGWYVLFSQLSLPWPSTVPSTVPVEEPVLVYGAAASLGLYIVQLLRIAGFTNIYAVASEKNHGYLKSLGATHLFTYNNTDAMVESILSANGGKKITKIVDCISADNTIAALARLIDDKGEIAVLLPIKEGSSVMATENISWAVKDGLLPKGATPRHIRTFLFSEDKFMRENLMPKILPELLEKGLLLPNRVKLIDEGTWLERANFALDLFRHNQVSGEKVVVKTPSY
ncbi:chaperonin 10-like protein [Flagelloscypha sp. PMI_526]|nr:chaperonin 10-like protein [Flagelloscypha sp. PMI_526]